VYFAALAEKYDAENSMGKLADGKSDMEYPYGYEIARLQRAMQFLNQAQTYAKRVRNFPKQMFQEGVQQQKRTNERLNEATDDNNSIYHDPIPQGADLRPVPLKQAVKLIDFKPRDPARHLFTNLVPSKITDLNNKVRTQCRAQYHEAERNSKEATGTAHATLASLGLPAAVECANQESAGKAGLPDKTWERVFMIQAEGGINQLQERFQLLHDAENVVRTMISEVNQKLERENLEDSIYRGQYGNKWTRNTSETANAKYRSDLQQAHELVTENAQQNTNLDVEFSGNIEAFTTLSFGRDELESQMPQDSPAEVKQANPHAEALIVQLDLLNALLEKRANLQDQYLEQVTGLDMTSMLLAGNQPFESVISQAKGTLQEIDNELKANVDSQIDILGQIQETFSQFDASRGGADANDPRTKYVHNLNGTCKKFETLSSDVNARISFYQGLQETFLTPMKQNVFDWAFARSEEAKIHVQSLGGKPIDVDAFAAPAGPSAKQPTQAPVVQQPMQNQQYQNIPPPQANVQPPLNQQGSINSANPWANPALMGGVQPNYMPGYTPVVLSTYPNGAQVISPPAPSMMIQQPIQQPQIPIANQQMVNQGIPQPMVTNPQNQALLQQQMMMQQQAMQQQPNPSPYAPAPSGGWPMGGANQLPQYQQHQYAYQQPAANPHASASAPQFGVTPQQYYQNQPKQG